MKKLLICAFALCIVLCSCSAGSAKKPTAVYIPEPTPISEQSPDGINPYVVERIESFAAESRKFRAVELPEAEAEIMPEPSYTAEELEILALVIYAEAGGDACSDVTRQMVGEVVLNRVAHEAYPNTIEGVLLQAGQYGTFSWTGLVWPARSKNLGEVRAIERAYACAEGLLSGKTERCLPTDVIYQSEYIMGEIVAKSDGMYFCREER